MFNSIDLLGLGLLLVSLSLHFSLAQTQVSILDTYNVDRTSITVSGVSSGGCMATQMHVALSGKFKGAAIVAGAPFYCAEGDIGRGVRCVENPASINISRLAAFTLDMERQDSIDVTTNLADDRVWIFHGALDTAVHPDVGFAIQDYYQAMGVNAENIFLTTSFPAEHSWPTEDRGGPCDTVNDDQAYLSLCGYETAYELLAFLYDDQPVIKANWSTTPLLGQLIEFDQTEFMTSPGESSMDSSGIVYVPSRCVNKTTECRLQVVYHGCNQGKYVQADKFIVESGFCQLGELNDVIMLFPQTVPLPPANPEACWDWWGYSDPQGDDQRYATRYGQQVEACGRMIDRVAGF